MSILIKLCIHMVMSAYPDVRVDGPSLLLLLKCF
jgi:hypothetical protein